jgi:hypothetical protein
VTTHNVEDELRPFIACADTDDDEIGASIIRSHRASTPAQLKSKNGTTTNDRSKSEEARSVSRCNGASWKEGRIPCDIELTESTSSLRKVNQLRPLVILLSDSQLRFHLGYVEGRTYILQVVQPISRMHQSAIQDRCLGLELKC